MNYKTIISFLIFAVIVVAAFLTISTFFDISQERRNYGVTVLSPSVSFKNVKNYQPGNNVTPQTYQNNNITTPSIITQGAQNTHASGSTPNSVQNTTITEQTMGAGSGSSYSRMTSSPNGNSSGMMTTVIGGSRTTRTTTVASSGLMAFQETKSSASPTYEPFSGGGSVGLPDPGGNADDSCDDDIVFLPVTDGLPFLIFLAFFYAIIKFLRDKINLQRLSAETSYIPGNNTEESNKQ